MAYLVVGHVLTVGVVLLYVRSLRRRTGRARARLAELRSRDRR
jgi:hypothetical protein